MVPITKEKKRVTNKRIRQTIQFYTIKPARRNGEIVDGTTGGSLGEAMET